MLVGKALYLRGGYLDNTLNFGEHGQLIGHSPQGSYTLSGVQIDRVRLTKHKVELEGARYGLHFLGALPYEDPTKAVDRVRITPKKKVLKITVDRELVVTPKKKKDREKEKEPKVKWRTGAPPRPTLAEATPNEIAEGDVSPAKPSPQLAEDDQNKAGLVAATPAKPAPQPATQGHELSDEDQAKAEMAAAPEAERPADPLSITTTTSPAHATRVLKDALDKIFAQGFDERMMASMPDFWKLYYQAVAAKADYRPTDPAVQRQNTVDKKARLLSTFEPGSNDFAQANGVAGMCLYHTVIGADGKAGRDRRGPADWIRTGRKRRRCHSQGQVRAGHQGWQTGSRCCWTWWCSSAFTPSEPRL